MGHCPREDHAGNPGPNLPQGQGRRRRRPGKPWLECAGELAHLHKEMMRIQKTIDEEFEQIEPEDWT